MADGSFTTLVSKDRDANALANTIYVQVSNETTALAIDGSGYITANINGSVTVTATDLDIRNLSEATDQVLVFANTAKDGTGTDYVPLVDADGHLQVDILSGSTAQTEYVEDAAAPAAATGVGNLMERIDTPAAITPIAGDWSKQYCNANGSLWVGVDGTVTIADGGGSITVDGTVAATQSGTWTVDLGATDNAVLDAIAASLVDVETNTDFGAVVGGGVEATALRVTIANDSTGVVTVDASQLDVDDLNLTDDAVQISGNATANSAANPIYVTNVEEGVSANEIHDYDTAADVAGDGTDNHDYTVANTTFLLKSVIVSGSGNVKFEIQTGPVASLATVAVGFLNGRDGDTKQINFSPAIEVPATSTGTVRVIRTNRQGQAVDVYSTIIGNDIT